MVVVRTATVVAEVAVVAAAAVVVRQDVRVRTFTAGDWCKSGVRQIRLLGVPREAAHTSAVILPCLQPSLLSPKAKAASRSHSIAFRVLIRPQLTNRNPDSSRFAPGATAAAKPGAGAGDGATGVCLERLTKR